MMVIGDTGDLLTKALGAELLLLLEGPRDTKLLYTLVIVTDVFDLARTFAVLQEAVNVPGTLLELLIVKTLLIGNAGDKVTRALESWLCYLVIDS